jgi:hypothetical protein
MQVVLTKDISLTSSNVSETLSKWDASTAYSAGDEVYYDGATPHKKYEALTSTTGDIPPDSPTKWADKGTTNRWAMFDESTSTTTKSGSIEVTIDSSMCGTVVLMGLEADSVAFSLSYDGTVKWTETVTLAHPTSSLSTWHSYYFDEIETDTSCVVDIPLYRTLSQLSIDIDHGTSDAVCAVCAIGKAEYLGGTMYGCKIGIDDYSIKDTDDFGNTYLDVGAYAKNMDLELYAKSDTVDHINDVLASARGTASVWLGNNDDTSFESLRIYGFYEDYEITLEQCNYATVSISVRGLV